jgi:hypothetical protein
MKIGLLVTLAMRLSKPTNIKVLFEAKDVQVVHLDKNGKSNGAFTLGDNTLLEGNGKDFNRWLKPFGNVFMGVGNMMMEEFTEINVNENPFIEE